MRSRECGLGKPGLGLGLHCPLCATSVSGRALACKQAWGGGGGGGEGRDSQAQGKGVWRLLAACDCANGID